MFRSFPWQVLLLKLAALFSFCGGPLVVADSLKTHMHRDLAFAIAFLPTLGLIFGSWSLWEPAVALVGMNVYAVHELMNGAERADGGLIRPGIVVGVVFVAYYAHASHRFFTSRRAAA